MSVFQKITQLLDASNIEYHLTEHAHVRTSEEAARIRGVDMRTGAKAMVLKSKDTYLLCVLPADRRINWKKIKQVTGLKEIRFATEEEAEKVTTVKMGSVPPFGNVLGLQTLYDKAILETDSVNFNPGSTTHSISMKTSDLVKLVSPHIVEIT